MDCFGDAPLLRELVRNADALSLLCLIDFLISRGVNVNSVDEQGMTAAHYAVQNFYVYQRETLALVKKLFDCGADIGLADEKGKSPYDIAIEHGRKEIVHGGKDLVELMKTRLSRSSIHLLMKNNSLFSKLEDQYLEDHRHEHSHLQREYDKRFGLIAKP